MLLYRISIKNGAIGTFEYILNWTGPITGIVTTMVNNT